MVSTSRTLINGAIRRGLREGMQKGIQQGIQQGMEEERLKVAARMRQLGLSEEIISQTVGTTEDK